MIQLGVHPRPGLSALERLIILFDHALVTPGYGSGDSAIEYEDHVRKARAEAQPEQTDLKRWQDSVRHLSGDDRARAIDGRFGSVSDADD